MLLLGSEVLFWLGWLFYILYTHQLIAAYNEFYYLYFTNWMCFFVMFVYIFIEHNSHLEIVIFDHNQEFYNFLCLLSQFLFPLVHASDHDPTCWWFMAACGWIDIKGVCIGFKYSLWSIVFDQQTLLLLTTLFPPFWAYQYLCRSKHW